MSLWNSASLLNDGACGVIYFMMMKAFVRRRRRVWRNDDNGVEFIRSRCRIFSYELSRLGWFRRSDALSFAIKYLNFVNGASGFDIVMLRSVMFQVAPLYVSFISDICAYFCGTSPERFSLHYFQQVFWRYHLSHEQAPACSNFSRMFSSTMPTYTCMEHSNKRTCHTIKSNT